MKLSEKLIQLLEEKLEDEETVTRIKQKIVAPAFSILRDEISNKESLDLLTSVVTNFVWPLILGLSIVLILVLLVFLLQIYQIFARKNSL